MTTMYNQEVPPAYNRIARARVDPSRVTGKTRHLRDGLPLKPPSSVEIVQIPPECAGYYLLYLDESGIEQSDTYHDSIALAMQQAEFEFGLLPSDWESLA
ncbi:MAG: hypothetical protein WB810_03110 [Candidatus Cybelea sp.]